MTWPHRTAGSVGSSATESPAVTVFETVPGVAIVAAVEGWKGLLVGNFQGSDKTTVSWAGQHLPPTRKQVTYLNEMYLLSGTSSFFPCIHVHVQLSQHVKYIDTYYIGSKTINF